MKEEYDKLIEQAQAMSDLKDGWQRRALQAEADAKDWRQYGHDCNVKWADTEDELEAANAKLSKIRSECETFYRSISESHDATALADAIVQHIDSDK